MENFDKHTSVRERWHFLLKSSVAGNKILKTTPNNTIIITTQLWIAGKGLMNSRLGQPFFLALSLSTFGFIVKTTTIWRVTVKSTRRFPQSLKYGNLHVCRQRLSTRGRREETLPPEVSRTVSCLAHQTTLSSLWDSGDTGRKEGGDSSSLPSCHSPLVTIRI